MVLTDFRKEDLLSIDPNDFTEVALSPDEIWHIFTTLGAVWVYEGEPDAKKPHAAFTSGKCCNGYISCRKVLCYPNLCELLAVQHVKALRRLGWIEKVDWVIGSVDSVVTWSYEVARTLHARHGFCEKDPADPEQRRMIWKEEIPIGAEVLYTEDLVIAKETSEVAKSAVRKSNPHRPINFYPFISALVHRPASTGPLATNGVVPLIFRVFQTWERLDCPYCHVCSARLHPERDWARLLGRV
ncbi:MAG: hypothetical protein WC845_02310 [Candidatus Staskawiczbacteria bacterium]|jgi:hypothetical protein